VERKPVTDKLLEELLEKTYRSERRENILHGAFLLIVASVLGVLISKSLVHYGITYIPVHLLVGFFSIIFVQRIFK
jgi:hypothetical protein